MDRFARELDAWLTRVPEDTYPLCAACEEPAWRVDDDDHCDECAADRIAAADERAERDRTCVVAADAAAVAL